METEIDLRGGHWTRLEGLGWMRTSVLTLRERLAPAQALALADGIETVRLAMQQPRLDRLTTLLGSIEKLVAGHADSAEAVGLTTGAADELRTIGDVIRCVRSHCNGRIMGHNGTYSFPCMRRGEHEGPCNRAFRYRACSDRGC